jgi:N-acetylmuramoyl-L-alanine amidase
MRNIGASLNGLNRRDIMTTSKMTQAQFVTWLKNSIGKKYDFDGWYGQQCYDYANAGWNALYPGTQLAGVGAKDIARDNSALLASRAKVYNNTPSFLAKPGDMVLFPGTFGGGYGHVAWVLSATLNQITVIEQNWESGGWTYGPEHGGGGWEPATKRTHAYDPNMIFIRPNFAANKATATAKKATAKVAAKKITWNWKGRFYPNALIKVRRGAGLSASIVDKGSWLNGKSDWVDIVSITKKDGYWWGKFKYPTNPSAGYFYCAVAKITDSKARIKYEKAMYGTINWK